MKFCRAHHIALYDVIESCRINGSSDSSIRDVVPADIKSLFDGSNINRIILNGKKTLSLFEKYNHSLDIEYFALPSTSPANATFSLETLIENYRKALSF